MLLLLLLLLKDVGGVEGIGGAADVKKCEMIFRKKIED
jgi:hypothetical protein